MREKLNSHLHSLYVRQDFESCLRCIESVLSECKGMSEYPVYVKALIKRQRGEIQESMQPVSYTHLTLPTIYSV